MNIVLTSYDETSHTRTLVVPASVLSGVDLYNHQPVTVDVQAADVEFRCDGLASALPGDDHVSIHVCLRNHVVDVYWPDGSTEDFHSPIWRMSVDVATAIGMRIH